MVATVVLPMSKGTNHHCRNFQRCRGYNPTGEVCFSHSSLQIFQKRGRKDNSAAAAAAVAAPYLTTNLLTHVLYATINYKMEPLHDVDSNVSTPKRNVSDLGTVQWSKTKRWRLRCTYYARPYGKGCLKNTAFMYGTQAEALEYAENCTEARENEELVPQGWQVRENYDFMQGAP